MNQNNKRILTNTVVLYGRLLVTMFVSFFTTRVVLRALGVEDLGLVNAIGGVTSMFAFISITLSTACSRYFSFELGRGEKGRLGEVFSQMMLLYIAGALLLVILLESIGSWYVLNKLVVPPGRESAAFLFFQLMIVGWLFSWFSVPYSAVIVSYENMGLFAVFSIVDVVVKLLAALAVLYVKNFDGLIFYGWLLMIASALHTVLHVVIVKIKYPLCRFKFFIDKKQIRELLCFNGWQAYGALAWSTSDCFVNLLLNSFFGPVVNASRLIAFQLQAAVGNFTQGFLTATRPQIVKFWAAGEREAFRLLFNRSSKIGYFLTFFFTLPLFVEAEIVLEWWLQNVPAHTIAFTRIVLIHCLINTFSFPLVYGVQAVGRIGLFTAIGSGMLLITWPVSWFALSIGCSPEFVFVIAAFVVFLAVIARSIIFSKLTDMSFWSFIMNVFVRMIVFSVVAAIPVVLIRFSMEYGLYRFLCVGVVSVFASIISFLLLGLDFNERATVLAMLKSFASKLRGGSK